MKYYVNMDTNAHSTKATEAMQWHRAGNTVMVSTLDKHGNPTRTELIAGSAQEKPVDENRAHCKHIAKEIEAYADGNVYHCPECGEEIRMPDSVGDKFKCPHCGEVNDTSDYEQLSVWDFLNDVFDIEYRCSSKKEYRSVRIMVACGGPNIYIDTADALVKLYWWSERAEYPLSYEARDAIDEWAEEYWNC